MMITGFRKLTKFIVPPYVIDDASALEAARILSVVIKEEEQLQG